MTALKGASPLVGNKTYPDAADGRSDDNRPIVPNGVANRVPTDVTTAQVLTIAYRPAADAVASPCGFGGRADSSFPHPITR